MRKIAIAFALVAGFAANANAQVWIARTNAGYLGIRFDNTMEVSNNARKETIIVREVLKDSPAEKGGVKAGDEIIKVNGLTATNGKFEALSRTWEIGDTVKLRVRRAGTEKELTVIAGKRPESTFTVRINGDSVRKLTRIFMDSAMMHLDSLNLPNITIMKSDSGFDFRVLTLPHDSMFFKRDSAALRLFRERAGDRFPMLPPGNWEVEANPNMIFRSFDLGNRAVAGAELSAVEPAMIDILKTDKGLLVLRVAPETPADRAGLQPGDVIVKAKARDVRTVEAFRSIIRANPEGVKLEVLRKGVSRSVEIKTGGR